MLFHDVNSTARCGPTSGAYKLRRMATGKKTQDRKPLEDWQQADATRLDRLFVDRAGMSQEKFANEFGIGTTQGSVWQYLKGKIPLNTDALLKFSRGLKVTTAEISPTLAQRLLDHPDIGRRVVANVAGSPKDTRRIPVLDYITCGNQGAVVDAYAKGDGSEEIFTDLDLGKEAFGLIIRGDSMLPEFKPGDKVIIDPAVQPMPGDFVVAKVNSEQEATFKKYRPRGVNDAGEPVFELVPLNEDYETIRSDRVPCRIIGTMVEHRKYRRKSG